jgi:hypothetical protein
VARRWVDERLGEGAFTGQAKAIGAEWGGVILPGSWYDVAPLCEVLTWASGKANRSLQDVTAELATRNAREDLSTIYRVFLRLASPVRLLSMTPTLWRNYVKFGEGVAVRNTPGHYIGECTGVPERFFDWAVGCWFGFMPVAIEMAGGKGARARVIDRSLKPGGDCRFQIEIKYTT